MAFRDCAKCLLFVFNLLSFMSGVTVLAVGAFMFSREGPFATLLPSLSFLNVTTLTMVVGAVIILVSFLGCCGAASDDSSMICAYFIIMLCILIAEITAGGVGYANRNQVEAFIERDLTHKGLPLYGTEGQHGLTSAWDRMQPSLSCCGVTNATDWSHFHPQMTNPGGMPDSCCIEHAAGCGMDPLVPKWERGCKDALIDEIRNHIGVIAGILIGIGVFQGLGVILSFALCCSITARK